MANCRGYRGPNLKRHLTKVHLRKNDIAEEDIDCLFQMGVGARKRRGPRMKTRKGRWKRWCPRSGCSYLGPCLPQQLQNKHKTKVGSQYYKLCLKVAQRYRGMDDELNEMLPPRSPTLKKKLPTPPLKRAMVLDDDSDDEAYVPPISKKRTPILKGVDSDNDSSSHLTPEPGQETPEPEESDVLPPTLAIVKPLDDNPSSKCAPETEGSDIIPPTPLNVTASTAADEDSSDDNVYPSEEAFFKQVNPRTNRHIWLVGFFQYLFTPAAGYHKDQNRLQHACQVKTILTDIDPNGADILVLAEDEGSRVWLDWVVPNLTTKAAGTIKSYLTSLQKFLEFVAKKGNHPHLPSIKEDTKDSLHDLAASLKGWRR